MNKQQKRSPGRPRVSGSLREKLRALAVSPIGATLRVENSSNTVRATIYDESQKGFLGDAIFTVSKADPSGADVWRIE